MTGIEALNKINNVLYSVYAQEQYSKELALIEKSLKALDIIKNKDVNVWYLTVSTKVKSYKDYNSFLMNDKSNRKLTEEEYDLLKEVLE